MTMLKITESKPIGTETFHEVIATLTDGRKASFKKCSYGQAEYPHAGTAVHVFESDYIDGGVIIYHAGDVAIIDREGEWGRTGKIIHAGCLI
jgi:hypothetical protein